MSRPAVDLRAFLVRPHRRVVLDLGCGDARATARRAAAEPDSLVIGADANLDTAERVIRRARRAPEKGGLSNLAIVRTAADSLPTELDGRVDELRVELPWGSLLTGLLSPDGEMLRTLAVTLAANGRLVVTLNARALPDGLSTDAAAARLRDGLTAAGLIDVEVRSTAVRPETGWSKRLAAGRPLQVIAAEARRAASAGGGQLV